jgi:hypothetical protein
VVSRGGRGKEGKECKFKSDKKYKVKEIIKTFLLYHYFII